MRLAEWEIPAYRLHRPTGQAVVTLSGVDHYLGRHGTQAALDRYDEEVIAWMRRGRTPRGEGWNKSGAVTVGRVAEGFTRWAGSYYRKHGRQTSSFLACRQIAGELAGRFGDLPAGEFGPGQLKQIRAEWIARGLSRRVCNEYMNVVRRAFAWAVEEEMVAAPVLGALQAVRGLAAGRSAARETAPRRPAVLEDVEATLGHCNPVVAAMVRLQVVTGMRPGEVCPIRPVEVDREPLGWPGLWIYRPAEHKTEHHGRERAIFLGPQGQGVLGPWLGGRHAFEKPLGRGPYTVNGYDKAILRAARRAGVDDWSPHRLRHLFGTATRDRYGLEHTQAALGHRKANTSEIYAKADLRKAALVALETG
jgi:integrase